MSRVYANMYILLVAPPGVGKTVAIRPVVDLWRKTKKLKVAPDDITKAAFIDHITKSGQNHALSPTELLTYHSLQVGADELGVLMPAHDLSFMSTLNALYDNRDSFTESRRGRDGDLIIENPQVSMLAGTQPDFLAGLLPPEAWGMGFMSRMIMVYAGRSPKPKLFGKRIRADTTALSEDLKTVCELNGEMEFTPGAEETLVSWYETGMLPEPEHTKLKHYVPRRILNILKLCIISAAARNNKMQIEDIDVIRARDWLLEVEALMPDVFKDMGGHADGETIKDMHSWMWQVWTHSNLEDPNKRKPIHISRLTTYLLAKTPQYNVENIIKLCKTAKIIEEVTLDQYKPGDRNSLRAE